MTYKEPVFRFRVLRQMNDPERNPNGEWSLVYSTPEETDADREARKQRDIWGGLGDEVKVVDGGQTTYIERQIY